MAAQRDVKRRVVMFTWFASFIIIVVLLGCLGAGEVNWHERGAAPAGWTGELSDNVSTSMAVRR